MLPSLRLPPSSSDEDLLASVDQFEDSTVGGSLDEPGSPAPSKPFKLTEVKFVDYPRKSKYLFSKLEITHLFVHLQKTTLDLRICVT